MYVDTYVATGEVTTLEHELRDDSVEAGFLVGQGSSVRGLLVANAENSEVLSSLWYNVIVQLEGNASSSRSTDSHVKKYSWSHRL